MLACVSRGVRTIEQRRRSEPRSVLATHVVTRVLQAAPYERRAIHAEASVTIEVTLQPAAVATRARMVRAPVFVLAA